MGVRAVDVDLDAEGLAQQAHRLEPLLIVRTTTTNVDLDLVALQTLLVLLKSLDDALEGRGDLASKSSRQLAKRIQDAHW